MLCDGVFSQNMFLSFYNHNYLIHKQLSNILSALNRKIIVSDYKYKYIAQRYLYKCL